MTTHTVLHNLVFGCLLVFLIQWIFLGDLRSAIIVGANIPFALFFAIIILVLRGEDANLLSLGAVDFGIIVDSAVIMTTPRPSADCSIRRSRVIRHPRICCFPMPAACSAPISVRSRRPGIRWWPIS